MPSGRLPQRQRQRRHRVNRRSAAPAIQTHPRTKIPLLTTPHRHHNVPVVPSVPISADRPSFVGHSDRVAGAGGSRPLVSTDFPFLQSTVAPEEGDSFMPAAAVSAAANRAGGMDDVPNVKRAPNQRLNMSNLTYLAYSHSYSPYNIPVSFWYAKLLTEPPPVNPPPRESPSEVAPEPDAPAWILDDLRMLATWPRLRVATLPEPVVGGHDFDPTGVSDRLGTKGLSVYSSFVERESFRCRVCGLQSNDMALALLHQRHRRHFQQ